ncbi:MAG: galactokinase [Gammaproteobacteria bacterium]|jgi:galactokinase|nr:galactokinase [Gammaproteobacteria bacterium]MBT6245613.1 galactokinase [Gammaproteobacteria bacterium]
MSSIPDFNEAFKAVFGHAASHRVIAPGRINLIGEHIDYCGGQVMPMAIDQNTSALFRGNGGSTIRVYSDRYNELVTLVPHDVLTKKQDHWSDYAQGLLRESAHRSINKGFDLLVRSTLDSGGLSSSSSFLALLALANHFALTGESVSASDKGLRLQLALNCQRTENHFVGIPSGIMDPASILLGGLIQLDCNTLKYSHLNPLPDEYCIIILDTSTPRSLASSGYAERVEQVRAIEKILGHDRPKNGLANLDPNQLSTAQGKLPGTTLKRRLQHLVSEQQRVLEAAKCLADANITSLGLLMNESHESLKSSYDVSSPELDVITTISRQHAATLGSRMTGAGFGGCAISLCHRDLADEHNQFVAEAYFQSTGLQAGLYITDTALPASIQPI